MGTGSAFSAACAERHRELDQSGAASAGRVELDPQQVARYPLRIGLSMNVTIETKNTDGPVLANVQRDTRL